MIDVIYQIDNEYRVFAFEENAFAAKIFTRTLDAVGVSYRVMEW